MLIITTIIFIIILSFIFSSHQDKKITGNENIGITTPNCPYCGIELNKFPGRKTKCKNCNNFIYVRTRPFDNKKILIKEDEILAVQIEWEKKNGTYEIRQQERDEFEIVRQELMQKRNSTIISDNDIKWVLYQQKRLKYANSKDWYNYGLCTEKMAQVLFDEKKYKSALEHYLEAEYFSMCCGGDIDGFMPKSHLIKYPNLLKSSFLSYVYDCIDHLQLQPENIREMFMNLIIININFPLTRNEAWKYLKEKLK